ncbi:MAG: HEAT repeat domain-containing protein [Legionellaceae bacterium]|nr:HEAT repeat domain-containing protein [Legionellaceae bacterium]
MGKFASLLLGLLLLSGKLYASPDNFDIFGVEDPIKQKIYSCCSDIVEKYLNKSKKMYRSSGQPSENDLLHRLQLEEQIFGKVKQLGDFAEVKISVVYYPSDQTMFGTMDIVKANEVYRIPSKKRVPDQSKVMPTNGTKSLLKIWRDYDERKLDLLRQNKLDLSKTSCPALHCTWGFDKEDIKNILPKLQAGVMQHKQALMNIIENSADDDERGDAIFLLAHDTHYQDIANFLMDFTDDASDLVRNNTMRVLGAIVDKHKVKNLKLSKIILALNYPYVTDRNKAAYVLFGIIKSRPETHAQVLNQSGNTLIELLKLKQPNNHDYAYQMLKVLSHKNYDENDYTRWSKWINEHQR